MPIEPGFVFPDIVLLRMKALVAQARADQQGYQELKDQYLTAAINAGYEGHIDKAKAMP
jgi:adenylate cyclase